MGNFELSPMQCFAEIIFCPVVIFNCNLFRYLAITTVSCKLERGLLLERGGGGGGGGGLVS